MTTKIRLTGPADVLAVLPYQLGFHPRDCLVAVSLRGSRMGLVQRIDLPPREHVREAVAAMIGPLLQDHPTVVLLIGFEEHAGDSLPMLEEMADVCEANEVLVKDRMVVRGGRWFDVDCTQSCCPPEGRELPTPSEVPAVAEFVGRGICPLPDRSALADRVEIAPSALGRTVSALAGEWLGLRGGVIHDDFNDAEEREYELRDAESDLHQCRANELAVWARVLCDRADAESIESLPPQDLAMLAVSLTDVDLRDALIAWLCPGTLPSGLIDATLLDQLGRALGEAVWLNRDRGDVETVMALQRIEHRLCELCAALPDDWAAAALTVLASLAWWRGDGALTRIALDRALRADPRYRLALLLERMVDLAIRPEQEIA